MWCVCVCCVCSVCVHVVCVCVVVFVCMCCVCVDKVSLTRLTHFSLACTVGGEKLGGRTECSPVKT